MSCVVPGCKSHTLKSKAGEAEKELLTFHVFPKDTSFRIAWIKNIGRDNWSPKKYSRICSKHFSANSFIQGQKRRWLLRNAVPELFLPGKPTIEVESLETGAGTATSDNTVHIHNNGHLPQKNGRAMNDKARIIRLEQKLERVIKVSRRRLRRNNALRTHIMRLEKKNVELYHILLTRLKPYCPIVESVIDLNSD